MKIRKYYIIQFFPKNGKILDICYEDIIWLMKKLIMTIPVLFAILVSATTSPAFAAAKVTNTSSSFLLESDYDSTICGITSNFHEVYSGQTFEKIWDNNHYKLHTNESIVVTDNNNGGALVLSFDFSQNQQGKFVDGTASIQANLQVECADGTTLGSIHVGNTFHQDGTVTNHHISILP